MSAAIHKILTERQAEAVEAQPDAPDWLRQLVGYWEGIRAKVITFNYDNLVELAWRVYVADSQHDDSKPHTPEPWRFLYPVPIPIVLAVTA